MTTSEVVFAAMKEAVTGSSGKALQRKFKVSPLSQKPGDFSLIVQFVKSFISTIEVITYYHFSMSKFVVKYSQGSVVFQISDTNETYFLDLKSDNPSVSKGDGNDPDLIITVESSNMSKLISGELKPQQAFMKGKLKVKGKMNLAMKLTTVLAATKKKIPKSKL